MQYKFTDTINVAMPRRPSIMMRFNGFLFEKEVNGYRTLSVSGRELIDENIDLIDTIEGRDGAVVAAHGTKIRELTVQYLLETDSNREYTRAFDKLNALLRSQGKKDAKIEFTDEPGVYYYGRYIDAQRIEAKNNSVVNEMRIVCADPYKYGEVYEYEGKPLTTPHLSPYPLKPILIKFTVIADTSKLIIKNITAGKKIVLDGTYSAGQTIEVEIAKNDIRRDGVNIMADMDFTISDFHDFLVSPDDEIVTTPDATVTMQLRKRWL